MAADTLSLFELAHLWLLFLSASWSLLLSPAITHTPARNRDDSDDEDDNDNNDTVFT